MIWFRLLLPAELHLAMKIVAARRRISMRALVLSILEDWRCRL